MASRGLGTLTLDLIARIGGFEKGLDKAARHADKRMREIEARAKQFGKAMGVALVAAASAATVALQATINSMDDMSKAAQKIGVPTEELSKLTYAAELADVSMETLVKSLGKLTQAQADALDETSEQSKVFKALGISVLDAAGKMRDSTDVLADFADAFAALKGSPEAQAAGFALFGRSFQNLVPLIKDGSGAIREAGAELEAFGGVLSTEAGQQAEQFNDDLSRLKTIAKSLGLAVASDLLPDLVNLSGEFVSGATHGDRMKEVAGEIADTFRLLGTVAATTAKTVATIAAAIRGVTSDVIAFMQAAEGARKFTIFGGFSGFAGGANENFRNAAVARDMAAEQSARIEAIWAGAGGIPGVQPVFAGSGNEPSGLFAKQPGQVAAEREADAMRKRLQEALANRPEGGGNKKKAGKSEAEKEAESLERAYQSMNDRLREQVALFGQDGEAARLRYELEHGELAKLDPLKKAELLQRAEKLDLMREEKQVQDELDAISKRREESVAQVLDDIAAETAALGLDADAQERLNMLRYAGVDANSAYGQSIIEAATAMQEARRQTEDQIELMDSFRQETSNAIADVVTGAKSLKEAFVDMFDTLAARITQMIAERWIEQLFGQQGSTGGGTQGGDWLGSLFGAFFGGGGGSSAGSLASLFSGSGFGFATGGYTGPGGRNELAGVVHAGEVVWSQDDIARFGGVANVEALRRGGGGAFQQTNNIVIQGAPDRRTQEQIERAAGRGARRAMARTGG